MYIKPLTRDYDTPDSSREEVPISAWRGQTAPPAAPRRNLGPSAIGLILRGWGPREIRPSRDWGARVTNAVAGVFGQLARWHQRAQSREALLDLDDRALRDIGLDRASAHRLGNVPFWRGE